MSRLRLLSRRLGYAAMTGAAVSFLSVSAPQAQTITAVLHAPVRAVDPVISTAYIVRDYAYMVYDTVLALDADNKIQPQMAEGWTVSPDGKTYTFKLRDGLKWHDGAPVTAEDCVASLQRWMKVDKMGQMTASLLTEIKAVDAKSFSMSFSAATDIALRALSKPSGVAPFILPKRVAMTPPSEPIKETIGSGPFRFVAAEFRPGVQAVFEKNTDYVPRSEPASGLAGGKVVKVDRVKWVSMPDQMTAVNALLSGEIDYIEQTPPDLVVMVENNPDIKLEVFKKQSQQNLARMNFTQPPFNNLKVRQAALLALDQEDVLKAQIGNAKYYHTCPAVLGCGSQFESSTGADKLVKGQPEKAAQLLKEAGYDNTPVVLLHPTDVGSLAPMPPVIAQALRKAGFNVEIQAMDWQTVTVRRTSKEPPSKGGWNMFATTNVLPDVADPLGFIGVAANGEKAWFGWPDVPAIEDARAKLARTSDPAEQKKLAEVIQSQVIDQVVMIPLGEFDAVSSMRKRIAGMIDAPAPVFWNVTKTGK